MSSIEDFLQNKTLGQQTGLLRIRDIVKKVVPEAEEAVAYDMPAMKYKDKYLIYFGAFTHHMSVYGPIHVVEDRLAGFKMSKKGTVQFTEDMPLPEDVIKDLVLYRKHEIDQAE